MSETGQPIPLSTVADLKPRQFARRDRIISVALNLSKERGFERVQMREVSMEANVALGTLYRYFPSRDLLLAYVLETWCEGHWTRLDRPTVGTSNTTRLIELSMRSVEAFEREPKLLELSRALAASSDPMVRNCVERVYRRSHEFFMKRIEGLPHNHADTIVDILLAAMSNKLELWLAGRLNIEHVYTELERYIRFLLEFRDPQLPSYVRPVGSA